MAILTKIGIPATITTGDINAAYYLPAVSPFNTSFGAGANNLATSTGTYNSAFGVNANRVATTGGFNSAFGVNANFNVTAGTSNSAFGFNANLGVTTGSSNSSFGVNANLSVTTGGSNSAFGVNANSNTGVSKTGNNNIVIGANNRDANLTSGGNNTLIGTSLTGYGNVSNTVIVSDGSNSQNIIADSSNVRTNRPIRPAGYTVTTLPSAVTSGLGAISYASNGRKMGELSGNGTGVPVWSNGTNWLTFYDNTTVQA